MSSTTQRRKTSFQENISYVFIPFMMEEPFDFQVKSSFLKDPSPQPDGASKKTRASKSAAPDTSAGGGHSSKPVSGSNSPAEPGSSALLSADSLIAKSHSSKYLFRYVAGKLDPDSEHCRCSSFQIREPLRGRAGIGAPDLIHRLDCTVHKSNNKHLAESIYYQIPDIQLYCFSTSVGILIYKLHFLNSANADDPLTDPMKLSETLFEIKDICRMSNRHFLYDSASEQFLECPNLYIFSNRLLEQILCVKFTVFFQYLGAKRSDDHPENTGDFIPRANILSILDVPSRSESASLLDDYKRELYYLRHCYNESYSYVNDGAQISAETHSTSLEICWGFSTETAICLTSRDKANRDFIEGTFYRNFNSQYLLTYILLLHQKYAIYMFLTKIDTGISGIKAAEKYKQEVHNFEMDFMFSHISEVPQYESLYEKLRAIFALDSLYVDVLEPLQSLNDDRRQESDTKMNIILFVISALSIFSAMVDGYDLITSVLTGDFGAGVTAASRTRLVFLGIILVIYLAVVLYVYVAKKVNFLRSIRDKIAGLWKRK